MNCIMLIVNYSDSTAAECNPARHRRTRAAGRELTANQSKLHGLVSQLIN